MILSDGNAVISAEKKVATVDSADVPGQLQLGLQADV